MIAACGVLGSLVVLAFGLSSTSAGAATAQLQPNSTPCKYPTLSQPFLSVGDANWYFLAPGQTVDNFNGSGWTLKGGATLKSTTVASGRSGSVLDLPSGATAISPTVCVDSGFQIARAMIRSIKGTDGVHVYANYGGTSTAGTSLSYGRDSGTIRGQGSRWTVSDPLNVLPDDRSGWQKVSFTFVGQGTGSESQIYNYYIDPRMKPTR